MSDLKSLSVKSMREDIPQNTQKIFWVWFGFTFSWMFSSFIFLMAAVPDATTELIALVLSPSIVFGLLMTLDTKHTDYRNSFKYLTGSSDLSWRDTYKLDAMLRKKGKVSVSLSEFSNSPDAHKKILVAENKTLTVIEPHPDDSLWDNTMDSVINHYNLSSYRYNHDWDLDDFYED